jgi:NitT/TauT family transport system permease protein
MKKYSLKDKKYIAISSIILIILWQLGAATVNNELLFPPIINVVKELILVLSSDDFLKIILSSIMRCLFCFIISIIIAVIMSTLSYINKVVYNFFYPILMIIKAIPTIAFIVLALIWMSKEYAPIIIGAMIAVPIFYDVTLNALVGIDNNLIDMFNVYRVSKGDKIKNLYLPTIIFSLTNVLSSSIALIFKVIIAGELYSQPMYGIGAIIQMEKMKFNTTGIIVWIILITITTIVFDKLLELFSNFINIWRGEEQHRN